MAEQVRNNARIRRPPQRYVEDSEAAPLQQSRHSGKNCRMPKQMNEAQELKELANTMLKFVISINRRIKQYIPPPPPKTKQIQKQKQRNRNPQAQERIQRFDLINEVNQRPIDNVGISCRTNQVMLSETMIEINARPRPPVGLTIVTGQGNDYAIKKNDQICSQRKQERKVFENRQNLMEGQKEQENRKQNPLGASKEKKVFIRQSFHMGVAYLIYHTNYYRDAKPNRDGVTMPPPDPIKPSRQYIAKIRNGPAEQAKKQNEKPQRLNSVPVPKGNITRAYLVKQEDKIKKKSRTQTQIKSPDDQSPQTKRLRRRQPPK